MTTELEAVNALLDAVGQKGVAALPVPAANADATMAYTILSRVYREVLSSAWGFNRESIDLVAASSALTLPSNTLSCLVVSQGAARDFVLRGLVLYDREARTATITNGETATVVATLLLPWTDLMEHARQYIFVRAARIFQDRIVGSDALHKYQVQDELAAYANLQQADAAIQGRTVLLAAGVFQALERTC